MFIGNLLFVLQVSGTTHHIRQCNLFTGKQVLPACKKHRYSWQQHKVCYTEKPSFPICLSSLRWNRRHLLHVALIAIASQWCFSLPIKADAGEVVLQDGVRYKILKKGKGTAHPVVGDLVGIRFRARYKDYVFDDIMESTEPYYLRVGSGNIIKGVEEVLPLLAVGELVHITVPSEAAFGSKGRRASPGRRAIPPNATLEYELELSELPGKEEELLEITGGTLNQ
eukprot:jgi/Galph1/3049/GphlegSOOS_G1724.1